MISIFRPAISLLMGLALAPSLFAQSPTHMHTLNNGLKVLIKEDHRAPLVAVQVWYAVGSVDEAEDKLGISHVLEHMMFKGTVRVPDNELKLLNASYGGHLNAITTPNYTYYYQTLPKDYLNLALELEADRMSGLHLKQRDFTTEIQVVMEERRQRIDDNPQSLAFEVFRYAAYPQSRYQNPVIGSMDTLNNIKLKDLQHWYNQWYAPNNATVVVVGNMNPTQTLTQIQRYFGDIQPVSLPPRKAITHPTDIGYRHVDIDSQTQVANLYMAWNVPSLVTAQDIKDPYRLSLLRHILNGQISSRLNRILIKEQKKLAAVNVSYDMLQRGDTLFIITAVPNPNVSLKQAQMAIQHVLNDLAQQPLSVDELERIRISVLAELIYHQDTLNAQAQLLGNAAINQFNPNFISSLPQHYKDINNDDIQKIITQYFKSTNLTTLYMQSEQQRAFAQSEDQIPQIKNEAPPTVPNATPLEGQ